MRNLRTLFGRASTVGMEGQTRAAATSPVMLALAAEHDIEVTSNLAISAAEVIPLCLGDYIHVHCFPFERFCGESHPDQRQTYRVTLCLWMIFKFGASRSHSVVHPWPDQLL